MQIENDEDAEFLSVDIVKETSVSHKHIVEVGLFQAGLEQIWKGKPLTEMCKLYDAQKELLEVESGNSHTVLFQVIIFRPNTYMLIFNFCVPVDSIDGRGLPICTTSYL